MIWGWLITVILSFLAGLSMGLVLESMRENERLKEAIDKLEKGEQ